MTKIKICGVTQACDAKAAAQAGVHALGLNFAPESPRYLCPHRAEDLLNECAELAGISWAGVFVNAPLHEILATAAELKLNIVQLHGEEGHQYVGRLRRRLDPAVMVWKAVRVSRLSDLDEAKYYNCDALLIDAKVPGVRGGSGQPFDWTLLQNFERRLPLVLSGGLRPENVEDAIRAVQPEWVDTASGVETLPGIKDAEAMRRFVAAVTR